MDDGAATADTIDFYLANQDGDSIDMMGNDWLATESGASGRMVERCGGAAVRRRVRACVRRCVRACGCGLSD